MTNKIYEKRLLSIFHDDVYNEIINFWKRVEESKHDIKIFVSKKCYVLYKVFMPVFNFNTYKSCIKLTDTAIPIFAEKIKGKTVLIIDDVFIHGTTSLRINKEIGQNAKKVDFYVFAKNCKSNEIQDISTKDILTRSDIITLAYADMLNKARLSLQEPLIKGYMKCNEYQWKRISDLIMKSFWGVNMPYVSYLPIFIMENKDRLFNSNLLYDNDMYSTHRQSDLQQHFFYRVKTNANSENSISTTYYCFAISKNEFMGNTKIVPMVFFDCEGTNINKEFIINSIKTIYSENTLSLLNYFTYYQNGKENSKVLLSLHKFLTFSIGYLAAKKWLKDNDIHSKEYCIDVLNACYSFGSGINIFLNLLNKTDENVVLKQIEEYPIKNSITESKNKKTRLQEYSNLLEGLKESYADMKSYHIKRNLSNVIEVLSRFFKFSNIEREKNMYKLNSCHIRGLRFSEIKDFFLDKGFSIDEIIVGLMYQYNLGVATIDLLNVYDLKDRIIGINMHWRAGEQSYKCISQTFVPIVYFENMYYSFFNKRIADYLSNVLQKIAENNFIICDIPFSINDLHKYCSYKDNVYNAFDIEKYAKRDEYKYLCYIGNQMQQYALRGYVIDTTEDDGGIKKKIFIENLFDFMKKHTSEDILNNCQKILFFERNDK